MARKRISGSDFEHVMWLLERRTDLGPPLRLIRFIYGEIEDYVARHALNRLAKSGKLAASKHGRTTYYEPKSLLHDEIVARKRELQSRPWNGRWCVLTYDIPAKATVTRKLLVRLLHRAGMGLLCGSSWASPYDWADLITERAEAIGASQHLVWALDAELDKQTASPESVARIWHLDKLVRRYGRIIEECKLITPARADTTAAKQAASRRACRAARMWAALQEDDPMLPAALLPPDWPSMRAERSISITRERIRELAEA